MIIKVSIVIPCRNEAKYIARCLNSIVNTEFDKNYLNVFVCDGNSNDGTREIIENYEKSFSFIHLLDNPKQATPFALNIGINEAPADIKIILGAHAEIHSDYIKECIKAFSKGNNIGCVGGIIDNIPENKTSELISLAMSSSFGVGNAYFRTGAKEGYVDTVAFGAYKSEVFKQIGLFDEDLIRNQDDEFNFRLIKSGYKIFLSKSIRAKYYVRGSFKKLFRQYYQYGYWKVYVNKKHKTITTIRQCIPLLFVLFLGLGILFSFFSILILKLFFIVNILYIIFSLYAALCLTNGISNIFKILFTFFILHFSYGAGYFEGIVNFLVLRNNPSLKSTVLSR